jgi:hypothetical protein
MPTRSSATQIVPFESMTMPYGFDGVSNGRHVQPPDAVRSLRREPDVALAVEHHRVRVLRFAGHDHLDGAGRRVEPADAAVAVAGVPHRALLVHDQRVRVGTLLDLVALLCTGRRVEVGNVIAGLADEPDPAVRRDGRVAGAPAPFDGPLLEVEGSALRGHRRGPGEQERG